MKRLLMILVTLIVIGSVFGQPFEGPFGLKMGLSLEELQAIDPQIEMSSETTYTMTNVPNPNSKIEFYVVKVSPTTGLSFITAATKDITTNGYGIEVKREFISIRDAVNEKYGECVEFDGCLPGSRYKNLGDAMKGLLMEEYILLANWPKAKGTKLINNIANIQLQAKARSESSGYVILSYWFDNYMEAEALEKNTY